MATLKEIYQQVTTNDDEKAALAGATKTPEGLQAFLAERGCDASPEEIAAFLQAQAAPEGELSDDELDDVAGGCNKWEGAMSAVTAGIYCAVAAIASAAGSGHGGNDGQILCRDVDLTTF